MEAQFYIPVIYDLSKSHFVSGPKTPTDAPDKDRIRAMDMLYYNLRLKRRPVRHRARRVNGRLAKLAR